MPECLRGDVLHPRRPTSHATHVGLGLLWRAAGGSVDAKDAAVAKLGAQERAADRALMEENAAVRRHLQILSVRGRILGRSASNTLGSSSRLLAWLTRRGSADGTRSNSILCAEPRRSAPSGLSRRKPRSQVAKGNGVVRRPRNQDEGTRAGPSASMYSRTSSRARCSRLLTAPGCSTKRREISPMVSSSKSRSRTTSR